MREPALPCPPHVFEEPAAGRARRRPVPVVPEHVCLAVRVDPRTREVAGRVTHTVVGRAAPTDRSPGRHRPAHHRGGGRRRQALAFHVHAGGVDVTFAAPLGPA
ncbi:MAG: hypothetical protein R3F43_15250 [bacterium]